MRGEVAIAWVEGLDARSFLHGLLTQDILALPEGRDAPALLLDAKGRIRSGMRVRADGPASLTLVLDAHTADRTMDTLRDLHFSERLDLLGPEPSALLVTAGAEPAAARAVAEMVLTGTVPGTVDLVVADPDVALAGLNLPEAPAEALRALRIEAGVPVVAVDTGERTLVQEAGLGEAAVSFTKGCYLGQETVARAQHRGGVRRALRGLLLDSQPESGAAVEHEGRSVGVLGSTAISPPRGAIGLAILHRDVEPGERVVADGVRGRLVALPFPPR